MKIDKKIQAFFTLVMAGLWENKVVNDPWYMAHSCLEVDWEEVYRLASEQSVLGLVLAGIDSLPIDQKPPKMLLLQWIGEIQWTEQQNRNMNDYVARLIGFLRQEDVYAILVKGQGIAQCYERPLWRASGDVDLLLSEGNYEKAKSLLLPVSTSHEREYTTIKHLGLMMQNGYLVELHGTLHSRLSKRVDKGIDDAQRSVFYSGNVRIWQNDNTMVFLPSPNEDVIFIFSHILHHYFIDGVGLRQICDWCRLLWTYKDSLDYGLLESRIRKMGLLSEWKAFATFAIDYLGMPEEAMPLFKIKNYKVSCYKRKADRIMKFVIESGNFGHNRPAAEGKMCSAWRKTKVFASHTRVFPLDSLKFFFHFMWDGIKLVVSKQGAE